MELLLGIDGGGTGCRAVVADTSGRILARAQGGPANIVSDPQAARTNIIDVAARAVAMVGGGKIAAAGLGLAGANVAGAASAVEGALTADRIRVETDAVTAAVGALGPRDGVVAAIGTGSVYALRRGDEIRQIGGQGLILGDEGSGAWLGRAALAEALRAADGIAPMTPWLASLTQRHGGTSGVIAFAQSARPSDFAALAPEILARVADDPAAVSIMAQAAGWVRAAIRALQDGVDPLPVVFTGGLAPFYAARFQNEFQVVAAAGDALEGALTLARGLL